MHTALRLWRDTPLAVLAALALPVLASGEASADVSDCKGNPPTWWGPALKCTNPCAVGVPAPSNDTGDVSPEFVSSADGRSVPGRKARPLGGAIAGRRGVLVESTGNLEPGLWTLRWGGIASETQVQVLAEDVALPAELKGKVFQVRPSCNTQNREETNPVTDLASLNAGAERQEIDTEPLSFRFRVATPDIASNERGVFLEGATMDLWLWRTGEAEPDLTHTEGALIERISPDGETGDYVVAYVEGLQHSEPGESFHVAGQLVTPGGLRSAVLRTTLTTRGFGRAFGCSSAGGFPGALAAVGWLLWATRRKREG